MRNLYRKKFERVVDLLREGNQAIADAVANIDDNDKVTRSI
jgi:hypothetical protein